jgi:hypothetical protein
MDVCVCRLGKTIMHAMEINRSTLQTRIDAFLGSVLDVRHLPCSCALPGSLLFSTSYLIPISGVCPAYACELRVLVSVLPVRVGGCEHSASHGVALRNPNFPKNGSSSSRMLVQPSL